MPGTSPRRCCVCGGETEEALCLPDLPLTGMYRAVEEELEDRRFDQELLICASCGHGQLKNMVSSAILYGEDYSFRTSASSTASEGARYLADHLERLFPGRTFERVLEFGCNDVYLLTLLEGKARQLLGVDPILKGREVELENDKIKVRGERVENVDLRQVLDGVPDLVVAQHTMEHIEDPRSLLEQLFRLTDDGTLFLFEFPCFDILLERLRFDQIFHQHLQYYSVRSFLALLDKCGGELVDLSFNYGYWGGALVTFRQTKSKTKGSSDAAPAFLAPTLDEVQSRYEVFCREMETTRFALELANQNNLFGYGAALMLPVLGYHLGTDFSEFRAILDDDPDKNGLSYVNLPVVIREPEGVDFAVATVCLTALDNRRPILKKLMAKNPREIINPLSCM